MGTEPSLLVKLLRKHPLGPLLQFVGLVGLVVLWLNIDPTKVASPFLKVVWFVAFISIALGMHLTHKHSFRLLRQRQAQASARLPSPWDSPSGG